MSLSQKKTASRELGANEAKVIAAAEEIIQYSIKYHHRHPTAPLRYCIEMGASEYAQKHSSAPEGLIRLAIAEIASRCVFQTYQQAAELTSSSDC